MTFPENTETTIISAQETMLQNQSNTSQLDQEAGIANRIPSNTSSFLPAIESSAQEDKLDSNTGNHINETDMQIGFPRSSPDAKRIGVADGILEWFRQMPSQDLHNILQFVAQPMQNQPYGQGDQDNSLHREVSKNNNSNLIVTRDTVGGESVLQELSQELLQELLQKLLQEIKPKDQTVWKNADKIEEIGFDGNPIQYEGKDQSEDLGNTERSLIHPQQSQQLVKLGNAESAEVPQFDLQQVQQILSQRMQKLLQPDQQFSQSVQVNPDIMQLLQKQLQPELPNGSAVSLEVVNEHKHNQREPDDERNKQQEVSVIVFSQSSLSAAPSLDNKLPTIPDNEQLEEKSIQELKQKMDEAITKVIDSEGKIAGLETKNNSTSYDELVNEIKARQDHELYLESAMAIMKKIEEKKHEEEKLHEASNPASASAATVEARDGITTEELQKYHKVVDQYPAKKDSNNLRLEELQLEKLSRAIDSHDQAFDEKTKLEAVVSLTKPEGISLQGEKGGTFNFENFKRENPGDLNIFVLNGKNGTDCEIHICKGDSREAEKIFTAKKDKNNNFVFTEMKSERKLQIPKIVDNNNTSYQLEKLDIIINAKKDSITQQSKKIHEVCTDLDALAESRSRMSALVAPFAAVAARAALTQSLSTPSSAAPTALTPAASSLVIDPRSMQAHEATRSLVEKLKSITHAAGAAPEPVSAPPAPVVISSLNSPSPQINQVQASAAKMADQCIYGAATIQEIKVVQEKIRSARGVN